MALLRCPRWWERGQRLGKPNRFSSLRMLASREGGALRMRRCWGGQGHLVCSQTCRMKNRTLWTLWIRYILCSKGKSLKNQIYQTTTPPSLSPCTQKSGTSFAAVWTQSPPQKQLRTLSLNTLQAVTERRTFHHWFLKKILRILKFNSINFWTSKALRGCLKNPQHRFNMMRSGLRIYQLSRDQMEFLTSDSSLIRLDQILGFPKTNFEKRDWKII